MTTLLDWFQCYLCIIPYCYRS